MMDHATLHRQVIFGESGGRIIWQPRIQCWYTDKRFAGEPLPAPYTDMDIYDIYRELGCSNRLYPYYNQCFKRVEHPSVHQTEEPLNETDTKITIETPVGKQIAVNRRTPNNPRPIPYHQLWRKRSRRHALARSLP